MGNVTGREDGENGVEDPSGRSDGESGFRGDYPENTENSGCEPRAASLESMGNTPPESPGRSRSPLLFTPQVPLAPLQGVADVPPIFNQIWMNDPQGQTDLPPEQGIPTLITWNHGGNEVLLEGSWDNWTSRKVMQRSGKDHYLLLVLQAGIYHYRFIVDGEWRYILDLPFVADEMGCVSNLLDVHDYVPENLESVVEFEPPPSPDSSYSQTFPVDEDFAKEPLAVPPQLHLTVLGSEETPPKPQHVVLNHLFMEKGWASQSLVALGLTHRFQSKYVTVVLYKPLKR
ncbi:SNF1-related protein kinase regulatory subunit beta-1-like [Aristolochia californica]|uniref:SNF1-related protein kinase regulatory subunit beta-1-like n=1 Tax=Aristolochia californica TaxID=171875 RepID=UPI0035DB41F4